MLMVSEPSSSGQIQIPPQLAESQKQSRIKRCYDYVSGLKSALSSEEFAHYLQFLRMLKENYVRDKTVFYASTALQIFFPPYLRSDSVSEQRFQQRKSLFLHSRDFYPSGDRESYGAKKTTGLRRVWQLEDSRRG